MFANLDNGQKNNLGDTELHGENKHSGILCTLQKRHKGLEGAEVSLLPGAAGGHQNDGAKPGQGNITVRGWVFFNFLLKVSCNNPGPSALQNLLTSSMAHDISRSRAAVEVLFSRSETKNSDFLRHFLKKLKRC